MKYFFRLLQNAAHQWRYLATGALGTAIGVGSWVFIPKLIGTAIDEALNVGARGDLVRVALMIFLVSMVAMACWFVQWYFFQAAALHLAHDLRVRFFNKLQGLSFGFHDRQQTGDLMSRATSDMNGIRWFIGGTANFALESLLTFTGVSLVLLVINWRLALIILAFMPPIIWRTSVMVPRMHSTWWQSQVETANMATVVKETLTGMQVVKAFGAALHQRAKFQLKAALVETHWFDAAMLAASRNAIIFVIFSGAVVATLWVGAHEVTTRRLTAGDLAAFLLYLRMLAFPLDMVGMVVSGASRAASAMQRIYEILDAESPVKEKPGARPLGGVRGHVRFEHVSMTYDGVIPAVSDIHLDVEPGQLVAILGAPGSGKSTIVHLVPRFYDVTEGWVTIDEMDVRDMTLSSLRRSVGIVMQEVFAFSGTLRENIGYGVDDVRDENIVSAARTAQLHEFIEDLPDGYATMVGERGITLSGGQRQRLAIARTILLDPPLLILDDSTSSVDVGTESLIQQALAEVVKGRTIFIIAHRLSTVRNADLILVMDGGEIVERGTHEGLMRRNGRYRRIHDLQLRPQEEAIRLARAIESQEAQG